MDQNEFAAMMKANRDRIATRLDEFLKRHYSSVDAKNVRLFKGEASDVISEFVRKNNVDLVVLGTVAQSGMSGVIMGNTAEKILDRVECSVLAIKPSTFVCPGPTGRLIQSD